jgi:carboxyl-terminal processing protease
MRLNVNLMTPKLFVLSALTLFFILFSNVTHGQNIKKTMNDSVKRYIDTIINIVHHQSLFKDSVNWAAIRDSVYINANGAETIEAALPAIQYIFRAIKDKHGALIYKGKWYTWNINSTMPFIRKELLDQLKAGPIKVKTDLFEGKYGYIQIPYIGVTDPTEVNEYAQQIQDSVCKLNQSGIKGWIIDLRLNRGGNMAPMITGIGNLIGDGKLGSFTDANGAVQKEWILKDGELYFDNLKLTAIENKCSVANNIKIAVLISQITASSGETTAIALKGRSNTKFFGEITSGFVTANKMYFLDQFSTLLVANSYEADRNHHIYKDFVKPDVTIIEGDNFLYLKNDTKIKAALKWLSEQD